MKPPFFARNALTVLIVIAFLMPFMFIGTRKAMLGNKNDVKSWLPAAYEETATYKWYRERFESDMFILVSWEGCTIGDQRLRLLAEKLVPPADVSPNPQRPEAEQPRFFKSVITGTQLLNTLVEEQGLSEEEAIARLQGFVIGSDGRQTCLVLTVRPEAEGEWEALQARGKFKNQKFLHAVVDKVYAVAVGDCAIPRSQLHMGGPPVENAAIDREGERSLLVLAGFSAAVGIVMSWWCLRNWGLTAIVFTTALFSAGISMAIVFYSGATMNCILLTMPSLVFVAAASGAIHMANYYRDTVRHSGLEGAPDRSVRSAWLPLALATGTTAIGLVSLGISELVPIKMFGVYSGIGVVVSFIVLCTYMPAMLQTWPLRSITEPRCASSLPDPGLSPRWRHVGEFIIRRKGLVAVACLILMVLGAWGTTKIETSVKLMRLFSPKAEIIQNYAWLEDKLGPLVPMEVVLKVDKQTCKLDMLGQLQLVGRVQQAIGQLEQVGSTLAAPTFIRPLPKHAGLVERHTWTAELENHREDLQDFLHSEPGEELWRVSARVPALDPNLDYGVFVEDLRQMVEPILAEYRQEGGEGISAVYTGLVPLIYKAQHSLLDGLLLGFAGDLILIGIAMVFLMRDWSAGLLLMLPSIMPLVIVFGIMGWCGIVVDTGTVMTPAVALGVTVDDAIHFMLWCRHGQQRGLDKRGAIMFAYQDCARAIYQSWGVIGLGLFAFAFSSFTPTQRFGYLMFAMLTASSIGTLVLLPALLASPAGYFFWKHGARQAEREESAETGQAIKVVVPTEGEEAPTENREVIPLPAAHHAHAMSDELRPRRRRGSAAKR